LEVDIKDAINRPNWQQLRSICQKKGMGGIIILLVRKIFRIWVQNVSSINTQFSWSSFYFCWCKDLSIDLFLLLITKRRKQEIQLLKSMTVNIVSRIFWQLSLLPPCTVDCCAHWFSPKKRFSVMQNLYQYAPRI